MRAAGGNGAWMGRAVSALASVAVVAVASVNAGAGPGLGSLEIACAAAYLTPATSLLGALVLTGSIGGAIHSQLQAGGPITLQVALGILVWLGLALRQVRPAGRPSR